jgi:Flp pilus assembly protein TadG
MNHYRSTPRRQRGVILVTFLISAIAMLLFFGLAIDVGFLYMSRAALAKSVDAAALMGVRNLSGGDTSARNIAESTFRMNYAASGLSTRQSSDPTVTVAFSTDELGNKRIGVNANVLLNTYFIRLLPQWKTMNVKAYAQASRARLVMGIALDRSGSMSTNGGAAALPGAVNTFISFFDDATDRAALSSYADHARLDVSMRHTFKSLIGTAANNLYFGGWTYSHGGIDIARNQIVNTPLEPNENVLKVLIFFTDGLANSFLGDVECSTRHVFRSLVLVPGSGDRDFRDPADGDTVRCSRDPNTFYSQQYSSNRTRNSNNVTAEGKYRAEQSAAIARTSGILVFAIGLGNDIDRTSLRKMANDPASGSFNPDQPAGVAVFAPTAADLDTAFRQIAAKILLRLTQ